VANPNDRGLVLSATNQAGAQSNSQLILISKGKDGWISRVGVQAQQYCPRGRVYATVAIIPASNPVPIVLWAGYVRQNECVASFPCIWSTADDQIQAIFTMGTNFTSAVQDFFSAAVDYVSDANKNFLPPAPSIFQEAPFTGPGEVVVNHTASIAAGTDVSYTFPAFVRQNMRNFYGRLTTSGVAGNRVPQPSWTSAGPSTTGGVGKSISELDGTYGEKTAASSAQTYAINRQGYTFGELIAESQAQLTVSSLTGLDPQPAGASVALGTESFDTTPTTGDQWTNVNWQLEEWAGPNP
jgi:hypothetical protein